LRRQLPERRHNHTRCARPASVQQAWKSCGTSLFVVLVLGERKGERKGDITEYEDQPISISVTSPFILLGLVAVQFGLAAVEGIEVWYGRALPQR
jgi:hypothetical protein